MRIKRLGQTVAIDAPAKLNLHLEVLGKRDDGFHEVETVMCPVDLLDRLEIRANTTADIRLELDLPSAPGQDDTAGDPAWDIPSNRTNLVVRAVEALRVAIDQPHLGCTIGLKKRIPAAAGMGGGSSDAAAALVGCMALWNCWDRALADQICSSLGSDLNFFLGDSQGIGLAIATGRGEKCEVFASHPPLEFVVTHPPAGCSTASIFAEYHNSGEMRRSAKIIAACKSGQPQKIGAELFNALQFSASQLNPWIERQLDALVDYGFEHVLMTGSGSACFGLSTGSLLPRNAESIATRIDIARVYSLASWYAPSIEDQLGAIDS